MQLEVLANYEDSLHHMGVLLCQVQNAKDASFLSAAMLDLHAGALLQQLSTHSSTAAGLSHSGTSAPAGDGPWSLMTDSGGVDASTAAVPASAAVSSHASWSELFRSYSHMHSSGGVVGVGGTAGTGGDSSSGKPVTGARWRSRTQRMWASITPEAVLDMKGITVTGLAGRSLRPVPCCSELHTQQDPPDSPAFARALQEKVCAATTPACVCSCSCRQVLLLGSCVQPVVC
jgi:hypothetical protein